VAPLKDEIAVLRALVEDLESRSERSGEADAFPRGTSANTPAGDGRVRFLTDRGFSAYSEGGRWVRFSDDGEVTE
jgi:hypothetical protein